MHAEVSQCGDVLRGMREVHEEQAASAKALAQLRRKAWEEVSTLKAAATAIDAHVSASCWPKC